MDHGPGCPAVLTGGHTECPPIYKDLNGSLSLAEAGPQGQPFPCRGWPAGQRSAGSSLTYQNQGNGGITAATPLGLRNG